MKRILLQLSIIFSLTSTLTLFSVKSFAQILPGNNTNPYGICELPPPGCQEEPLCTYYDDCFRFDFYAPVHRPNGTTVLKHKITNFSESTFRQAAFELPGAGSTRTPAILPQTTFRNRYNHNVVNPFNDTMIAYNAINAGTFSYGGFEMYYYIVNTADFNAASGRFITITAKAGRPWQQQRTGKVVIEVDECLGIGPGDQACLMQESDHFKLLFPFFAADANDEAAMNFTLINKTASDVEYISIEPSSATVSPLNGTSYQSPVNVPFYTYDVTINSPLQFTRTVAPPSTIGYVNGARDIFNFSVVNTDFGNTGALITVIVKAGTAIDTFYFECAECGDFPINPLPVELTSFQGKDSKEGITLNWSTASEKNNDRFEIERSTNGRDFEKIASVKGNGNSSAFLKYDYLDRTPRIGTNYYRLRQVDFNGDSELSKTILVKHGVGSENLAIAMVPNPCPDGQCSVRLSGVDTSQPLTVELKDLTGRLIFSKQIAADKATFELPKTDAGKGIYILSATNGEHTTYQKIILQ